MPTRHCIIFEFPFTYLLCTEVTGSTVQILPVLNFTLTEMSIEHVFDLITVCVVYYPLNMLGCGLENESYIIFSGYRLRWNMQ